LTKPIVEEKGRTVKNVALHTKSLGGCKISQTLSLSSAFVVNSSQEEHPQFWCLSMMWSCLRVYVCSISQYHTFSYMMTYTFLQRELSRTTVSCDINSILPDRVFIPKQC